MTKFFIRPYKAGSSSAKALAEALGGKRLKLEGSTYRPRPGHVVINWGGSTPLAFTCLNTPEAVAVATNKLKAFQAMEAAGVSVPPFTTNIDDAKAWVRDDGKKVVVRKKLSGHSGEGIVIAETVDQLEAAPLYTRYVPKAEEYRVHVGRKPNGDYEVIFRQRKARKLDVPDDAVNWQVRNLAGGFVFAHNDIDVPGSVLNEAILAVEALELDFGAVDVVWNNRNNKAFVLEANTACGLEGETINAYTRFFQQF